MSQSVNNTCGQVHHLTDNKGRFTSFASDYGEGILKYYDCVYKTLSP